MRWSVLVLLMAAAIIYAAVSQISLSQPGPSGIAGCVYNATLPTLADKQVTVIQCDINGKVRVH